MQLVVANPFPLPDPFTAPEASKGGTKTDPGIAARAGRRQETLGVHGSAETNRDVLVCIRQLSDPPVPIPRALSRGLDACNSANVSADYNRYNAFETVYLQRVCL